MEDYNKLVEKNQTGEIDDLEFFISSRRFSGSLRCGYAS